MTKVSFHTTITASETQIQLEEEQIQPLYLFKASKRNRKFFLSLLLRQKVSGIWYKDPPKIL